jgi:DNA helicase HerA-like ATPase
LIEEWVGGPKPISVLDLSGIPATVLRELIGALLRILYNAMFWARNRSEGGRERPLLLVLEEAHSYLGDKQSGTAAEAVKRIAKEGRKYGVGLMLVSQRPAEIDSTILSQCGTIFAMRLANDTDRGHVTGAASDNLKGLFDMLPVLRTGEAIIVGEAVSLPIRTLIDRLPEDRRPDSDDPRVVDRLTTEKLGGTKIHGIPEGPGGWNRKREPGDYAGVIEQMRRQNPHYKQTSEKTGMPANASDPQTGAGS